ncbi:hypothetical protein EAS68_02000 [Legionella jordanis]|uniref:hypothetical protein n=1 Tax=Legionella jordanis TaxID=456 RepID=UPI000F00F803|nr:hypothetical protein [Legionella jordanis]RMX21558.1 hypothetical protein EAS68_02000 [Legionella jordanis]HAT8715049.1 hypothetical protein [Legionella jordanis]
MKKSSPDSSKQPQTKGKLKKDDLKNISGGRSAPSGNRGVDDRGEPHLKNPIDYWNPRNPRG